MGTRTRAGTGPRTGTGAGTRSGKWHRDRNRGRDGSEARAWEKGRDKGGNRDRDGTGSGDRGQEPGPERAPSQGQGQRQGRVRGPCEKESDGDEDRDWDKDRDQHRDWHQHLERDGDSASHGDDQPATPRPAALWVPEAHGGTTGTHVCLGTQPWVQRDSAALHTGTRHSHPRRHANTRVPPNSTAPSPPTPVGCPHPSTCHTSATALAPLRTRVPGACAGGDGFTSRISPPRAPSLTCFRWGPLRGQGLDARRTGLGVTPCPARPQMCCNVGFHPAWAGPCCPWRQLEPVEPPGKTSPGPPGPTTTAWKLDRLWEPPGTVGHPRGVLRGLGGGAQNGRLLPHGGDTMVGPAWWDMYRM